MQQYSKISYSINGSWQFNEVVLIDTFSSFEKESIGSVQFHGEIINIMCCQLSLFEF